MSVLAWLSFCSLFGAAFSCDAYLKTNQWPDRSVIVQMFEWKWLDIADECERFLGPKKYGAVQTSPASENVIVHLNGNIRPWYERYQPISYRLTTRSGDEAAFLNMTTRCNKVGVRVYVDVVFNHMTGENSDSVGTGGSTATTQNNSFPGVPYTDQHFHHPVCAMENLDNATEVRVCQLSGLIDLNQTIPYVRSKIIDYLNNLIDLGAAGIRVDAAKHMWPEDLNEIYKYLHNLNTNHGFRRNSRPYIYQEVAKGGVVTYNEYKDMGDITEFTAGSELAKFFSGEKTLKNLRSYGTTGLDMMPSENAVVFVDNHDTQRAEGILTYKNATIYKAALAFLLAHPYGQARITSSYYFTNFEQGPPADSSENITPPALDTDGQCTAASGWVCEHRWSTVSKMVAFRNEVHKTQVQNWWDDGNNQIAFSLGNKGFIAFNTEGTLNRTLQTGLPAGTYCDIRSGQKQGSACTGKTVTVSNTGLAQITLSGVGEELYLAIHVGTETMSVLAWLSFCSLFGAAFSCDAYLKTNQWPDRSVIVQMFEWKWLDIADECERFLGPKKYGAVQTSPASENLVLNLEGGIRPWYERYQVMSYKLATRSGDEAAFLNMTTRCNRVGVRIYVDVVFNHMTIPQNTSNGVVGTAGSTAFPLSYSYPAVPYTEEHFHFPVCQVEDYENATELRVCQLGGLQDLNQTKPYVRQRIIEYLNKLIDLGVAGIRVDAAKHMWPEDLSEIYKYLNNLNTNHGFRRNSRPYIYQEVSKGGVVTFNDYNYMGDITEFTAGSELYKFFSGQKSLKNLRLYGTTGLDMMPSENAVVFVDNHDTQRVTDGILSYKNSTLYQAALAFLLAHPYGQARITSSFYFNNFDQGPPADTSGNIQGPVFDELGQCTVESGWVCEHRWRIVYKMVGFRNEVHNTEVANWWDNGNNQIAFSLGNKGFIVFNTEGSAISTTIQTGLPAGTYCDITSGEVQGSACTGKTVTVSNTGQAQITLSGVGEELYLALHVGTESALQTSRKEA